MDVIGRLILRVLLVPLGGMVAVITAVTVAVFAHWNAFMLEATSNGAPQDGYFFALIFAAPAIMFVLSLSAVFMLVPAAIGVLIAETFAIRSWIYHAANGGLSAWIGWSMMFGPRDDYFTDPLVIVASGLAAGFAYWLVAGWTSGFWKPVSRAAEKS